MKKPRPRPKLSKEDRHAAKMDRLSRPIREAVAAWRTERSLGGCVYFDQKDSVWRFKIYVPDRPFADFEVVVAEDGKSAIVALHSGSLQAQIEASTSRSVRSAMTRLYAVEVGTGVSDVG